MKSIFSILSLLALLFGGNILAQRKVPNDSVNGDWTLQHEILLHTAEAQMMIRTGDIDNLGFGWPSGFNPFSGQSTPSHGFPWAPDTLDAKGTDRIMVVSSYNGNPPQGSDGYTSSTSRPGNLPRSISLDFTLNGMQVTSAVLQLFVDDFQAPVWGANYYAALNGHNAPYLSNVINSLVQTGPVGKIITVVIPAEDLYLLQHDSLNVMIDDTTTGAGDGFAIDFVKLLVNLTGFSYTGTINGIVTDVDSGLPVQNAIVSASSVNSVMTDATGFFTLSNVPAGINRISATKFSYDTASANVDLQAGQSVQQNFQIRQVLQADFSASPLNGSAPLAVHFTDQTSMNPTIWNWDFGDGQTSSSQNPDHTYQNNGNYTVTLTASNGTESDAEIKTGYIHVGANGIQVNQWNFSLTVDPNPIRDQAVLSYLLPHDGYVRIILTDYTGKDLLVLSDGLQSDGKHSVTLSLGSLPAGEYFLRVQEGNNFQVKKLIVVK
jgi:PKD repeat protein